jgi:hypothetical protein
MAETLKIGASHRKNLLNVVSYLRRVINACRKAGSISLATPAPMNRLGTVTLDFSRSSPSMDDSP